MLRQLFAALTLVVAAGTTSAQKTPEVDLKPDGKPADRSKKVKVFVLLGQSNMLGFGRVGPNETKGSLEYLEHFQFDPCDP